MDHEKYRMLALGLDLSVQDRGKWWAHMHMLMNF